MEGKVTGIKPFGAFVALPESKTGLVHISEVSYEFVQDLATVLEVGQTVKVKVISIAPDGKIASRPSPHRSAHPARPAARAPKGSRAVTVVHARLAAARPAAKQPPVSGSPNPRSRRAT